MTRLAARCGLLVALALLAGCSVRSSLDLVDSAAEAAEPTTDRVVEFAVDKICDLPIDVMARNIKDDPLKALAAWAACSDLRVLVDAIVLVLQSEPILPDGFLQRLDPGSSPEQSPDPPEPQPDDPTSPQPQP